MKIREVSRISERVFQTVVRLVPQLNPESELPSRNRLKEILKSKATHFFIAEPDNNEIAGIMTVVIYEIPTGKRVWIEDVVVDEAHRGEGIGKALIAHAIDFAGKAGAKHIDLTSRPFRKAANKLYSKMGFDRRETNVYRYTIK